MATTKSKKEILDYLWEWAEGNGEWAKSIVKKVIEKEIALSAGELDTVYNTFLASIAPSDDKTPSQIERPQLTLETADLGVTLSQKIVAAKSVGDSATGLYIIVMAQEPAIAYEGDIQGYLATKPGKGGKINPNSAHVRKYSQFLKMANQPFAKVA